MKFVIPLVAFALLAAASAIPSGKSAYHLWKLPPEVRQEFQQAQQSSGDVDKSDRWVQLASNEAAISFLDVSSVKNVRANYVKARILYVFASPLKIGNQTAKLAYRDGIYNCTSHKRVTARVTYFGGVGDTFKQIIPGNPEEVDLPVDTIERAEAEQVCGLEDLLKKVIGPSHKVEA